MSWDNEFEKLCDKFGLPDSRAYIETLKWKEFCADFHHESFKEIYNLLEREIKNEKIIEIMKNGRFGSYIWEASGEAASCVHVTRTMVDLLLQIINKSILKEEIFEHEVTFSNVKQKLKNRSTSKIVEKLKILEGSKEFEFVRNLDNKLKHRNLVPTDYVQTNLTDIKNLKKGLKFQSFKMKYGNRNPKEFPEVWIEDITDQYRRKIVDLIEDVGNEMNEYLRNNKAN